jgi:DGQHR domain-containing protein
MLGLDVLELGKGKGGCATAGLLIQRRRRRLDLRRRNNLGARRSLGGTSMVPEGSPRRNIPVEAISPLTLDPSEGQHVKGIPLSEHAFLAVTRFAQLKAITRDPLQLQPNARGVSEDLEDEIAINELIQRALKGNKKSNMSDYASYIEGVVAGRREGVLPPMHLWSERALHAVEYNGVKFLLVPNDLYLASIDGQTQLAAHYRINSKDWVSDPETKDKHKAFPLGAVIHHGVPVRTARLFFHDLNVLAVRPNTSLSLGMDSHDPLIKLIDDLETEVLFLTTRVDRASRQLSKASHKVVTLQALRQMVINIAKGISGIQFGARPAPMDDIDLEDLHVVARDWLNAFFNTFSTQVQDREKYLISTGAVLAAVGAMGHRIFTADPSERHQLRNALIASLQAVDWRKNEPWVGIAGKVSEKGKFVVGGTKEVAYAVYNVLSDADSDGYRRVRGTRDGAAIPVLQPAPQMPEPTPV